MAYNSGMLNKRVTVLNRTTSTAGQFGMKSGEFVPVATIWAAVDFTHGVKAMREGALDAYDTVMIRCRYTDKLNRSSRIEYDNKTYQIQSFNADKVANTIQITAMEMI